MLRRISIILSALALLILPQFWIDGQDQLSALRKKLREADNDTLRIAYLNQMAHANIGLSQTDSAISYAKQALGIAERIKSDKWAIESLISIAEAHKLNKKFAQALDYYLQAVSLAEGLQKTDLLASTYMELGLLYQDWNLHEKAIEHYKKVYDLKKTARDEDGQMQMLNYIALAYYQLDNRSQALHYFSQLAEQAKKNNNDNLLIASLRNIANIHATNNDNSQALEFNMQILDLKTLQRDSLGIATYLNNIGFIYQKLEQRNKAKQYFLAALDMNRRLKKDEGENVVMLLNIGVIYQYARDYDNALRYFKEALAILEVKKDYAQIAKTCNYITTIYVGIQDYESAKEYTLKAIDLAGKARELRILASSYNRMSDIYEKQRNNKKALEYYKLYASIKDSLLMEEQSKQKMISAKKIEAEQQEKELKLQLADQEKKNLAYQKQQLEAEKIVQDLALKQREQDLVIQGKELELARLKELELNKEKEFQSLKLEQQHLEAERRKQEIDLLEKQSELERQQRILKEKEAQEHVKEIDQLKLSQKVKDLEIDNFKQARLFAIISAGLGIGILGIIGIGYVQKNKANRKLASINVEINRQKNEIESQNDQITQQKAEIERSYQDIKLLSVIGQKITASLDIESVSRTVFDYITSLMSTNVVGLGIYSETNQRLEFRGSIEDGQVLEFHHHPIKAENSLAVWSFQNHRQILINNFDTDYKAFIQYKPAFKTIQPMKSAVYLPLITENRPIGVMTVQSRSESSYGPRDVTILQTLASYISIALDNANAYEIIQTKNKHITDSIRYAQTIQKAILPSKERMSEQLKDHFVLYYPKDIVSGDFFWFLHIPAEKLPQSETIRKDKTYLAVVDCTGHGVPGAFMSMIGNTLLNDIVNRMQAYEPAEILELLHTSVVTELRQMEGLNDDGMDICLCLLEAEDDGQTRVTYTGAKRPLYYMEPGSSTIKELKGTNKNIGGATKKYRPFTNESIVLPADSVVYMSTDGLPDQNDRDNNKIGSIRFKYVLQENYGRDMEDQKEALAALLFKHQSGVAQRDDITVVGVKL